MSCSATSDTFTESMCYKAQSLLRVCGSVFFQRVSESIERCGSGYQS